MSCHMTCHIVSHDMSYSFNACDGEGWHFGARAMLHLDASAVFIPPVIHVGRHHIPAVIMARVSKMRGVRPTRDGYGVPDGESVHHLQNGAAHGNGFTYIASAANKAFLPCPTLAASREPALIAGGA